MRSDNANLLVAKGVAHQRGGCFGRVTLALMLGRHTVSNLNRAVGSRRPREATLADDALGGPMQQHKTMNPWID